MSKRIRAERGPRPMPLPGSSLAQQLDDHFLDKMLPPLLAAVGSVGLAGMEWWRYFHPTEPSPWGITIFAALMVGWALWSLPRRFNKARQIKLGMAGERAVGQYLEWFRSDRHFVFHDIPTISGNIDHLLIGPKGLFTIETKTLSKPERGACVIRFAGDNLEANGRQFDRNPIIQAKAEAGWVRNFLRDGRFKAPVWPVVIIPGWFVEPFDMRAAGVWVLETKALKTYVLNCEDQLTYEEVKAIASAIKSYVLSRTAEK